MKPKNGIAGSLLPGLLLTGLLFGEPAAAEVAPRKCVAFFVGIEKFDDAAVNPLKFVGEDTFAVWKRLKEITNLDEKRSTLLVVDRESRNEAELPTSPHLRTGLASEDVRKEFQSFLRRIENDDLVIVYLQGHGLRMEFDPEGGPYLLCSDFARRQTTFDGGVQVSDLTSLLKKELKSRPKPIDVVFFANMCHAGEAYGAMSAKVATADELSETALSGLRQRLDPQMAYIAAAAANAQAFEIADLGRSEFAYNLLEALGGAGSDKTSGEITTKGILTYLQTSWKKTRPPDPTKFLDGIVIGHVADREAEMRRFLANTLLAIALDQEEPARGRFLRLAETHFARCMEIHGAGKLDNLLSRIQCRLLLGKNVDDLVMLVPNALASYKGPKDAPTVQRAKWLELPPNPPGEAPFVVVALWSGTRTRFPLPGLFGKTTWLDMGGSKLTSAPDRKTSAWLKFLGSRSGFNGSETLSLRKPIAPQWEPLAARWRTTGTVANSGLVLVYSGTAGLDEKTQTLTNSVPRTELWEICRQWGGNVLVIWDAPFGGVLSDDLPQDLKGRVQLLLTASQKNGMTFGGSSPDSGSTKVMLENLRGGVNPEALIAADRAMGLEAKRMAITFDEAKNKAASPTYIGTPILFGLAPNPLAPSVVADKLANYGLPSSWWAMEFALRGVPECGSLHSLNSETATATLKGWSAELKAMGDDISGQGPFVLFRRFALCKALRHEGEASEAFAAMEKTLNGQAPPSEVNPDMKTLREIADRNLQELRTQLRKRDLGHAEVIHAVLAESSDYKSSLIGDLSGPPADVEAWSACLKEKFANQVKEYRPASGSSADIWSSLLKARAACAPNDVLLFFFSGRGAQLGDERFLIAENATLDMELQRNPAAAPKEAVPGEAAAPDALPEGADSGALSVSDIAATLASCPGTPVVLLDCQFLGAERRHPLQKHMESIRPADDISAGNETTFVTDVTAEDPDKLLSAADSGYLRATGRRQHLPKGIFVWSAGDLREPDQPASENEAVSPFSRYLIDALKESTERSYGEWLKSAALASLGDDGDSVAYVIQGAEDEPIFAYDNGAMPLRLLLSNHPARLGNMDLAVGVCDKARHLLARPLDQLTRLMLLNARVTLLSEAGVPALNKRADADSTYAASVFKDMGPHEPALIADQLLDLYLDAGVGALESESGADDAIEFILAAGRSFPQEVYQIRSVRKLLNDLTERALHAEAEQFLDRKIGQLESQDPLSAEIDEILSDLKALRASRGERSALSPVK